MKSPESIKQRKSIDPKLGIKSSKSKIRVAVASLYVLYVANDRKSRCYYSKQDGDKIALSPQIAAKIDGNILPLIEKSPLFDVQFEPLYVFINLVYSLGIVRFKDKRSEASERTGNKRFEKYICFSTNMILLDNIISSFETNVVNEFIFNWLNNKACVDSTLENKVKSTLQIFSEQTVYKLRNDEGEDLILQTEGIYDAIDDISDEVNVESSEPVGPYRIVKSALEQNLNPYIRFKDGEKKMVTINQNVSLDEFKEYRDKVSVSLDLLRRDIPVTKETVQESNGSGQNEEGKANYQLIYYGAPGTGKSHKIDTLAPDEATVRTTFHPDSDYSTFVGAYKPTMYKTGEVDENGKEKEKISYKFVPQAFVNAYIKAWKDYPAKCYLVIEEINRGNCAQIFGDLFQLLDRNEKGFSRFSINANRDLQMYIADQGLTLDSPELKGKIEEIMMEKIISGEKLLLPDNLFIWATMNTSDQSLFPIDSAFKRRWDWIYVPISNAGKEWKIDIDGKKYDWWNFIDKINEKIEKTTESQDKKLGYFFINIFDNKIIDSEKFVCKVLFYFWNDVLRDYPLEGDKLMEGTKGPLTFESFFDKDTGEIDYTEVKQFLKNLDVQPENPDPEPKDKNDSIPENADDTNVEPEE